MSDLLNPAPQEPVTGTDQPQQAAQTPPEPVNAAPQTPGQPGESEEDLRISRAHFQTKAQEETERRKALEGILNDLGVDPAGYGYQQQPRDNRGRFVPQQPQPQHQPQPQQVNTEDYDDPIVAQVTRAVDDRLNRFEQQIRAREQAQMVQDYQVQYARANDAMTKAVTALGFTQEDPGVQKALKEAASIVPDIDMIGQPPRFAKAFITALSGMAAQRQWDAWQQQLGQVSADKVSKMQQIQQPAGAATLPTGAPSPNDYNKTAADQIAKDDVVLPAHLRGV